MEIENQINEKMNNGEIMDGQTDKVSYRAGMSKKESEKRKDIINKKNYEIFTQIYCMSINVFFVS